MLDPKRIVIVISTGRSGTAYVAHLLMNGTNAKFDHEELPRPSFVLGRLNRGEPFEEYASTWCRLKAMDIERTTSGVEVFGDASHVWPLCVAHPSYSPLLDRLLCDGADLRVVHLTRDVRRNVESLVHYGAYPNLYQSATHFAMLPEHPLARVPWPTWREAPDDAVGKGARALWYRREVDAIADAARARWGSAVAHFAIEDLNDRDEVARLADHCGIDLNWPIVESLVIGKPANSSAGRGQTPNRYSDDEWKSVQAMCPV